MVRTFDVLDRVTAVTYPDSSLNVLRTYDDPAVPFSKGRLTRIARPGSVVDYRYDRFGRVLQDGNLGFTWDANGNAATLVYPGDVTAVYTYDFADRPATLLARRPGRPDQPLATAAAYLPSGPLSSLTLGNSLLETRGFDDRYFPSSVSLAGISQLFDWTYSTDAVGNILSITDALTPAASRTYGYQDVHYFLTRGDGPWGPRTWTYDKIGNRLTETRGAATDTYTYLPSSTGGRSPLLSQVQLGAGGTRTYQFGPAGHLESVSLGASSTLYRSDAAGRLSALENPGSPSGSTFRYDGRDYLTQAAAGSLPFHNGFETGDLCGWTAAVGSSSAPACPVPHAVQPTYSSEGLLHALQRNTAPERSLIFHFAGRPVAQLDLTGGTEIWTFLTTDHLGTPIAATGPGGALLWQGGFEPFGADWSGAAGAGMFLRFPGQWAEGAFGGGLYYNVHRWYEVGTGRYGQVDPLSSRGNSQLYGYAEQNPLFLIDRDGQQPLPADPGINPALFYLESLGCLVLNPLNSWRDMDSAGPRWTHCMASCQIKKCSGSVLLGNLAGLLKEDLDYLLCELGRRGGWENRYCRSAYQESDYQDNAQGLLCPENVSCEKQCEDLSDEPDTPPGPIYRKPRK